MWRKLSKMLGGSAAPTTSKSVTSFFLKDDSSFAVSDSDMALSWYSRALIYRPSSWRHSETRFLPPRSSQPELSSIISHERFGTGCPRLLCSDGHRYLSCLRSRPRRGNVKLGQDGQVRISWAEKMEAGDKSIGKEKAAKEGSEVRVREGFAGG